MGGSLSLDGEPITYAQAEAWREFVRLRFELAHAAGDRTEMAEYATVYGQSGATLHLCERWRMAAGWVNPRLADRFTPAPDIEAELWRQRVEARP
jgi:hypothetical protein